jgi:hypothetical protein
MSWIGSLIGGAQQFRQADIDKDTQARNKQIGEFQAEDALKRGTIEQERYRRQLVRLIGAQKAEIGARNVEQRGSALDLLEDSAQIGEEDLTQIRNDAARTAWGYRVGASEQSRFYNQSAINNRAGGIGSLLTGAAQAYGQWKKE